MLAAFLSGVLMVLCALLYIDKRELVEMLEKYQSHNRINNDTESGLFEEAAALIAKHKEG